MYAQSPPNRSTAGYFSSGGEPISPQHRKDLAGLQSVETTRKTRSARRSNLIFGSGCSPHYCNRQLLIAWICCSRNLIKTSCK
jgi:hypothetical protein